MRLIPLDSCKNLSLTSSCYYSMLITALDHHVIKRRKCRIGWFGSHFTDLAIISATLTVEGFRGCTSRLCKSKFLAAADFIRETVKSGSWNFTIYTVLSCSWCLQERYTIYTVPNPKQIQKTRNCIKLGTNTIF